MTTHTHLRRGNGPDDVNPDDVDFLREAVRLQPAGRPLRAVLDDLLRVLCSSAQTGQDVVVDIGTKCHRLDRSSSASRQHYIDTGRYLTHAEVEENRSGR